jgi:hypothetical protein
MREKMQVICPTSQAEYFLQAIWTGVIALNRLTK